MTAGKEDGLNETTKKRGEEVRKRILGAIVSYIKEHGYAPTVREICDMVGLKSTSSVQSHLIRMLADGVIETDAGLGTPRAIRVPGYKFVKIGSDEN